MAKKMTNAERFRNSLTSAVGTLVRQTRLKRYPFDATKFLLLFWDEPTLSMVNTVRGLARREQLDTMTASMVSRVLVEHPVYPQACKMDVGFNFEQPAGSIAMLWPRDFVYRMDADEVVVRQLEELKREVVADAADRAVFHEVCDFLIENCANVEAARYLFPPFMMILRMAGYREMANQVEHIKKPPVLPPLPYLMRQKIRHAIQWFAMQELLGTWERSSEARTLTDVYVTLAGNYTVVDTFEDREYDVKLKL